MKRLFVFIVLSALCTSNVFSQKMLYDDIICPDSVEKGNAAVTYSYWNNYNLKYCFKNYDCNLTSAQCRAAIQNAFNTWSQYSLFTFTETSNLSQADIEISWEADSHSGCTSFSSDALAHASVGKYNRTPPAYVHFRKSITFTMTSSGWNLQAVALHEIGHVLGLTHDTNHTDAVMYNYYGYKLDLTGYDLSAFYGHYAFPGFLTGPNLICTYGTYEISNFPSGLTTSWKLSDNYYNTHNCLMSNYPSTGHCLITRDNTHDMMDATLTAYIKKGAITVDSLKLKHLYAYAGFKGSYTSGSLSGNINSSGTFNIKTNTVTTVTSPNFYGATVTYSSSGATPSSWGFNSSSGILNFNTLNTTAPVIINVSDGCGNNYTLYAFPSGSYNINVSNGEGDITVTLVEDGDASKDFTLDEPWTMEITSATTGKVMATLSSTCRSETISTAGWPKGIYIVKVTIGKEELTEKVLVK